MTFICYNIESPVFYLTKYGERFDTNKIESLRRRSALKEVRIKKLGLSISINNILVPCEKSILINTPKTLESDSKKETPKTLESDGKEETPNLAIEKIAIDNLDDKDLAVTFEEKYEFYIPEIYTQKIMTDL